MTTLTDTNIAELARSIARNADCIADMAPGNWYRVEVARRLAEDVATLRRWLG